jgi:PAS domain S-box-containing protein
MNDNRKTKTQLITEVQELRRRVSRMEDALKESEQRYRRIIETAQEAIWVVDAEANTTDVNQHLAEMLGYTREELLGRSVFDFVNNSDRPEAARYLERGKSGSKEQHDFRFRRKDGTELWTMVSSTPLFDGSGSFVGGLAMLIDITERRRSEEALSKREDRWRTYIEQANDLIFILNETGKMVSVNKATCETTGYGVDELLGRTPIEFVIPEHRAVATVGMQGRLAGVAIEQVDLDILSKDGRRVSLEIRGRTLYDGDQVSGAFEIARDITDRKRAEEELVKTQERLQHVLSFSPAIIYLLQIKDGKFTAEWVSESLTRLTGHERGEALAEGWCIDHIHPQDRARVLAELPRLLTGDRLDLEFRFQHKDGGYLWLHNESRLLRDQSGKPVEVVGSWVDVTERREAEVALRDSEERFRTLVSSMDDMVFTVDLHQRHTGAFGRWIERFGLERRDLIGRTASEIFGVDAALIHEQAYARALAGEQVIYEWSMAADGEEHYFQTSLSPIRDQSGKVTGLVGVGRDSTERKRAGEALLESEERYRELVENARDIIYTHDLMGNYTTVNKAAEQITGYSREEALKMNLAQTVAPEYLEISRQMIARKLAGEKETVYDLEIIAKDGHRVKVEVNTRLVFQDDVPVAIQGIARDVTERKLAEDDLRKQKEILQKVFDHIPIMIALFDEDGRVKLVNREWERTLGWSMAEIETHPQDIFAELYPDPGDRKQVLDFIAESSGEWADFKTTVRDGQVIDTSWANVYLSDGTNMGIGRDISERKRAHDLLQRQTAQLAALHEIGLEISAESELSRVLDVATRRAAELLSANYCSVYIRDHEQAELNLVASLDDDLIGLRVKEGEGLAGRVVVSGDSEAIDDYSQWYGRASIFDDKSFGPSLCAPLKWQHTVIGAISLSRKKGSERFTNADLEFLEQIAAEVAIAIHQTTLFEEVQEGQRRLQVLSHRLIDAQEAERKRLARELHDQIGQALTAVQISLQTLQSSTRGSSAKFLEDSLAIIDEALEQVHDLSLDLRPSLLDDLGLVAALRWYVGRVASRAGLVHGFKADDLDTRLAPEVETACFRIAQEALTNVLRHASATNVSVEITSGNSDLRLLVRDDGVGFDVRTALSRTGLSASLGLQGMQERAAAIGGSVDIESKLRRGTRVQATLLIKRTPSS